jgi:hypothetical protein
MRIAIALCLALTINAFPAAAQKEPVPAHARTGWSTLVKDSAHDFVQLPKRQSTWVILGIGAGAAGLGHLEDDYIEEHLLVPLRPCLGGIRGRVGAGAAAR